MLSFAVLTTQSLYMLRNFQAMYDGARKSFQLVGVVGDPVYFTSPDELQKIIADGQIKRLTRYVLFDT